MYKLICFLLFFCSLWAVHSQERFPTRTFDLGLEFRPRFEFRDGFQSLPVSGAKPTYFITSRTRLSFNFKQKKSRFHCSIQDVRLWGQNGLSPAFGSLHVFETYGLFPISEKWKLKIGRQAVEIDNGRLFSKANWSQFGRAHDGISATFTKNGIQSSTYLFYNQDNIATSGTTFNLNAYKYLFIHHLKYTSKKGVSFQFLNTFDGYQKENSENTVYVRGTSGGRFSFKKESFSGTIASFYQYGQLKDGTGISAYYVQPELSYSNDSFKARLGAEWISGDEQNTTISSSFSTLYGVAFKFMGHLNYFTSFPSSVRGAGLVNPYLFFDFRLNKRLRLKTEGHSFFTQRPYIPATGEAISSFLGLELDINVKYKINKSMGVDFGFSALTATESMAILKGGNPNRIPVFSFLMLTWKPTLFSVEQTSTKK